MRHGRIAQLQREIGFQQVVRLIGRLRQTLIVGQQRGLLQRILGQRRARPHRSDGRVHRLGHLIGIERSADGLGAHDEPRAAAVVVEPGVARRFGLLVERLDGLPHGFVQLAVRSDQLVGFVVHDEYLDRPGPRAGIGVHGIRHAAAVDGRAHVRRGERQREPLTRHAQLVAFRHVGQQILNLGGGFQRHVLAHDRGVGHEAVHEHERARQVDDRDHGDERAARNEPGLLRERRLPVRRPLSATARRLRAPAVNRPRSAAPRRGHERRVAFRRAVGEGRVDRVDAPRSLRCRARRWLRRRLLRFVLAARFVFWRQRAPPRLPMARSNQTRRFADGIQSFHSTK